MPCDKLSYEICSVPSQSILAKWLREVHKLHIEISLENFTDGFIWQYQILKIGEDFTSKVFDGEFDTYERALDKGLARALRLIKNE